MLKMFLCGVLLVASQLFGKTTAKFVMISHAGPGDSFWSVEFNGAKQAAADMGVELQILSPQKPNDIARQVKLFEAAIAGKPQGIAISLPDDRAFSRSLKVARDRGLRVIAFNSRPQKKYAGDNPYAAFVGMDDYQAGRRAGKRILKKSWPKGSRFVVAIHQAGHIGLEKRYLGIAEVLKSKGFFVDKLDVSSDASRAQLLFRSYVQKQPKLQGLVCTGSEVLHALGPVLERRKPRLYTAAFDLSQKTISYLESGLVEFAVDQQPYMQGYMAISQLVLAWRADISPAFIDTSIGMVDKFGASRLKGLVSKGLR